VNFCFTESKKYKIMLCNNILEIRARLFFLF
jgi:hypothetical protein